MESTTFTCHCSILKLELKDSSLTNKLLKLEQKITAVNLLDTFLVSTSDFYNPFSLLQNFNFVEVAEPNPNFAVKKAPKVVPVERSFDSPIEKWIQVVQTAGISSN